MYDIYLRNEITLERQHYTESYETGEIERRKSGKSEEREGGKETHELPHTGLFLPDKTACHTHPCILRRFFFFQILKGFTKAGR